MTLLIEAPNWPPQLINWLAVIVLLSLGVLLSEGADAGERAAHGELVNGLGAFVGDHALQVQHVAHGTELGADAGRAQQVAAVAGDVERHARIVPLGQRYLRRRQLARILEPAQLQ